MVDKQQIERLLRQAATQPTPIIPLANPADPQDVVDALRLIADIRQSIPVQFRTDLVDGARWLVGYPAPPPSGRPKTLAEWKAWWRDGLKRHGVEPVNYPPPNLAGRITYYDENKREED